MMKHHALVLLLVSLALAGAAPIPAPAVPDYASYGDWLIACDNGRSCEAKGFDDSTAADLRILRPAGDVPAQVVLIYESKPGESKPAFGLTLDGTPLHLTSPHWTSTEAEGQRTTVTSDPGEVASIIARLRDAHRIGLGGAMPDADGSIPLDGFAAVMLRMDEVQGRVGTLSALVGTKGTKAVPAAPDLPALPHFQPPAPLLPTQATWLIASVRQSQAKALAEQDCDHADGDEAHALDGQHAVVILACSQFAYQASAFVFVVPRDGGAATAFTPTLPTLSTETEVFLGVDFDPKTGMLSDFEKGRGIADCGLSASWIWSEGKFRLISLERQEQCGGAGPGDWPTLYRVAK